MKKIYCVLCKKKHANFAWKYKKWSDEVEGWACDRWYKSRYTRIIPMRIRKQADNHRKELLQPFKDETTPNEEFMDAYQNEVNLRNYYHDHEIKRHLGPKYLETHEKEKP